MPVDRSWIGRTSGRRKVVIEQGPVAVFARAVMSDDPVFTSQTAAMAAGHERIPATPTFLVGAAFWGQFPDLQAGELEPSPPVQVARQYLADGGLMLHGEQGFTFTRPVYVGDVLESESTIVDVFEKQGATGSMVFAVIDTTFTDVASGEHVATVRLNLLNRT